MKETVLTSYSFFAPARRIFSFNPHHSQATFTITMAGRSRCRRASMRPPLRLSTLLLSFATENTLSFESSPPQSLGRSAKAAAQKEALQICTARRFANLPAKKEKKKCDPCTNPFDDGSDAELDRREAAFAMVGALWAASTGGTATSLLFPESARATAGDLANIQLPNPIEGMTNRATKQCLVESLGNRECLLYADDGAKIYQGADSQVLLDRVKKATLALATIPELIQSKKWSKVTGVMTGPMGELVKTMGQLADLSQTDDAKKAARSKIKAVKNDLYAIAAAVDRKDGANALKGHAAATDDLVAFIKSL